MDGQSKWDKQFETGDFFFLFWIQRVLESPSFVGLGEETSRTGRQSD